jgi:hypothetical protein
VHSPLNPGSKQQLSSSWTIDVVENAQTIRGRPTSCQHIVASAVLFRILFHIFPLVDGSLPSIDTGIPYLPAPQHCVVDHSFLLVVVDTRT